MRKIQLLLLIFGIIFLLWFILPLLLSNSINLGNITGITVSVLLLLYAVFMPQIHAIFDRLKTHFFGKCIFFGFLILLLLIAGFVILESACMIRAANRRANSDATVIVLGCRVYGENASLSMIERLNAAGKYLLENEDTICILSGGQGEGENISEAECMYRYLVEEGIDPKRLYKEERSTSTRENLSYSQQLIKEQGLNPTIAIVTSEYHEYRAGKIAESLGMEYGAIPAKTAFWLFPTYYVRELYGILYEWVLP